MHHLSADDLNDTMPLNQPQAGLLSFLEMGHRALMRAKMTQRKLVHFSITALAVAHLAICLAGGQVILSNVIQLLAVLSAALLCLKRARTCGDVHLRRLWYGLSTAFGFWAAAQAHYTGYLALRAVPPPHPDVADFFWLSYSFPILLVASCERAKRSERDWTQLLDASQTGIAAIQVCLAVLMIPGAMVIDRVYDIQGFAMLFACAIRYSTTRGDEERTFFRNLTVFVLCYDVFGLLSQIVPQPHLENGGIRDLAWSLSFLTFSAMAIGLPKPQSGQHTVKAPAILLPAHIHGVSALGLVLTSVASSVLLLIYHLPFGFWGLIAACVVFAARMALRESKLYRTQVELEHDNLHDRLTGLPNRVLLERELERSNGSGSGKSFLLLLDLDRFKIFTDSFGRAFGDQLLTHIADLLRSTVRVGDVISRFGGDEFVVVLKDCGEELKAKEIADRILHRLSAPILLDQRIVHVTGSIGIAAFEEGRSTLDLLNRADAAMYMAKSAGKNCVHFFDRSILDRAAEDLEMESDLRQSVEDGRISVAYQPLFTVDTHRLVAFEALARWEHPRQGHISPERFIPLAEETGLILQLGMQVLTKACFQVAAWNREFGKSLCLGVNVSGQQLAEKSFFAQIDQVLKDSGLDPSLLRLEITESVLIKNQERVAEILQAACASGIEICLDDFGTGYSALNYLVHLPFHTIKIDRGFLRDVEYDTTRAMLVRTIVQLAKNLNKKVVAEGVETAAQLDFLASVQCDLAQGYLLSRPLSAERTRDFLKSLLAERSTSYFQLCLEPALKA